MAPVPDATTQPTAASPLLRRGTLTFRSVQEQLVIALCFLCAAISVVTTFGILWILAEETFLFFQKVSPLEFFLGTRWAPLFAPPSFGILPLVCGTALTSIGAGLFALPLGLLAGIYLSEYASPHVRNLLKPALEVLAGIPTVVYGYFGVFFITPLLRQLFPSVQVFN
ncbi:MAG TPA: hypothetical protein VNJ09_01560, partial [Chthonomonadales bacterium]|nr:hypothetical protein [Chthonomonadales bacterium]